ncbi:MAG TPA: Flp family type IVb pilin [Acidobacteriaceae bacterium]|nr:Flp family type IVb pilin [Acidobacteriaceae bacterium]
MKNLLAKLYVQLYLLKDNRGQDLIEYALLVALIAFAATAGMSTLATDINTAFTKIGTTLTTYTGGGGGTGGGTGGGFGGFL